MSETGDSQPEGLSLDLSELQGMPGFDETMEQGVRTFMNHMVPLPGFLGLVPFQSEDRPIDERYHMELFYDHKSMGLEDEREIRLAAIEAQKEFRSSHGHQYNFAVCDINADKVATALMRGKQVATIAYLFRPAVTV